MEAQVVHNGGGGVEHHPITADDQRKDCQRLESKREREREREREMKGGRERCFINISYLLFTDLKKQK